MKQASIVHCSSIKNKNEVLQLRLDDIVNDIITSERYIDIFGFCTTCLDVKNDKLFVRIHNDKNHIKMALDISDICKGYGYTNWKYIEVVDWEHSEYGCIRVNKKDRTPMIQFTNGESNNG